MRKRVTHVRISRCSKQLRYEILLATREERLKVLENISIGETIKIHDTFEFTDENIKMLMTMSHDNLKELYKDGRI